MAGQYYKSYLLTLSNGEMMDSTFTKISYTSMMKIVTNDTYLGFILSILKNYMDYILICHFYLIKWKLIHAKNLYVIFSTRKTVTHIKALKQALNHGLILEKVHRIIEFNRKAWLRPYIDMDTELRTNAKYDFGKDFFKLINNSVFGNYGEC